MKKCIFGGNPSRNWLQHLGLMNILPQSETKLQTAMLGRSRRIPFHSYIWSKLYSCFCLCMRHSTFKSSSKLLNLSRMSSKLDVLHLCFWWDIWQNPWHWHVCFSPSSLAFRLEIPFINFTFWSDILFSTSLRLLFILCFHFPCFLVSP